MKKKNKTLGLFVIVTVVVLLLGASSARAMDLRGGDNVVIGANEVINDDVYISANTFTLDGVVKGDLIVFAKNVQINGTVEGDLMAAAQAVNINGTLKDGARIAAAVITLGPNAHVADDVLTAGGSIETKPGSTISGGLFIAGSQALLAGNVDHNFVFRGANLSLQGRVAGAADVSSGATDANNSVQPWMFQSFAFSRDMPAWPTVPAGLTFGENANIGGQLDYTSPQAVTIPASAAGNVKFTPMPVNSTGSNSGVVALAPYTIGNWLLDQLRSFIALAVAGLLLVWLLPAFLKNAAQQLAVKPLPSLGWGFVIAILVPVGAVVLLTAATIIAVALGFLTLGNLGGTLVIATVAAVFSGLVAFSLAMAYVTKIIVAYWLGHWVLSKLSPGQATSPIVAMLVGLLPLGLLTGIPTVGWLISLVITLMGLGAVWLMWRRTPSPMSMSLPTPSLAPLPTATLNVSAQQPV